MGCKLRPFRLLPFRFLSLFLSVVGLIADHLTVAICQRCSSCRRRPCLQRFFGQEVPHRPRPEPLAAIRPEGRTAGGVGRPGSPVLRYLQSGSCTSTAVIHFAHVIILFFTAVVRIYIFNINSIFIESLRVLQGIYNQQVGSAVS